MLKKWKSVVLALAIMAGTVGVGLTVVAPDQAAEAAQGHPCQDFDGDGWGHNGFRSCKMKYNWVIRTFRYENGVKVLRVQVPCIDFDGDGAGWAQYKGKGETCYNWSHFLDVDRY